MLRIIKESFYIIIASVMLGFAINLFHPSGFILKTKTGSNQTKVIFLNEKDAYDKYLQGNSCFIDARSSEEYIDAHVHGAISIPAFSDNEFKDDIEKYLDNTKNLDEFVIYCWNSECSAAEIAAEKFIALGMGKNNKVFIIKDGFEGWLKQDYPVDK